MKQKDGNYSRPALYYIQAANPISRRLDTRGKTKARIETLMRTSLCAFAVISMCAFPSRAPAEENEPLTVERVKQILSSTKDFSGKNLTRVELSGFKLNGINFSEANLEKAKFTGADLTGPVFTKANLKDAHLMDAILRNADFTDANVDCTSLDRSDLTGAKFVGANLHTARLDAAVLDGDDFRDANLEGAHFQNAITKRAVNLDKARNREKALRLK